MDFQHFYGSINLWQSVCVRDTNEPETDGHKRPQAMKNAHAKDHKLLGE